MRNTVFAFLCALCLVHISKAQNTSETPDDTSINGQFETLIRKSTNYRQAGKRYEVIRLLELQALQKNILDTIRTANTSIGELRSTIAGHETTLASLNTKLDATTKNLTQITEEKDSMSFFGALMPKKTYKLIVWSIIFGLLAFLLLFIYRFRNSNTLTRQAKLNLADVEQEFEEHRRRALEREQKISRKLQDEINRNKKSV